MRRSPGAWLAATATALLLLTPGSVRARQGESMVGTWTLNREASEFPRNRADSRDRQGPGGGGGGFGTEGGTRGRAGGGARGGRRGRTTGGDPGGNRPTPEQMQRMRAVMQAIGRPVRRFTFRSDDSTVSVEPANRGFLTLHTNRKKWKDERPDLGKVEYKAEWKEGELRVERKFEGGLRVRDTYSWSEDDDHLVVEREIRGGMIRRPMKFKLVYDRVEN